MLAQDLFVFSSIREIWKNYILSDMFSTGNVTHYELYRSGMLDGVRRVTHMVNEPELAHRYVSCIFESAIAKSGYGCVEGICFSITRGLGQRPEADTSPAG